MGQKSLNIEGKTKSLQRIRTLQKTNNEAIEKIKQDNYKLDDELQSLLALKFMNEVSRYRKWKLTDKTTLTCELDGKTNAFHFARYAKHGRIRLTSLALKDPKFEYLDTAYVNIEHRYSIDVRIDFPGTTAMLKFIHYFGLEVDTDKFEPLFTHASMLTNNPKARDISQWPTLNNQQIELKPDIQPTGTSSMESLQDRLEKLGLGIKKEDSQ